MGPPAKQERLSSSRASLLVATLLLCGLLAGWARSRLTGKLSFQAAQTMVDALRRARDIKEPFVKGLTLSLLPTLPPASSPTKGGPVAQPGSSAREGLVAVRPPHPLTTLYFYWEGGCLEVSALLRRANDVQRLVIGCNSYELAEALPLERKQWRLGIAPKAVTPALLLLFRVTEPITTQAFLSHLSTFERSARYLASHVLPSLARKAPARRCPKAHAGGLPVELLTD